MPGPVSLSWLSKAQLRGGENKRQDGPDTYDHKRITVLGISCYPGLGCLTSVAICSRLSGNVEVYLLLKRKLGSSRRILLIDES